MFQDQYTRVAVNNLELLHDNGLKLRGTVANSKDTDDAVLGLDGVSDMSSPANNQTHILDRCS